jgi:hypothetical protein
VTPFDRILAAFRSFVQVELARLRWLGSYEYSVVSAGPGTVDVRPVDPSTGLPAMTRVPLRSGLLGQTVQATPGSLAIIRFVNGSPSRPVCTSLLGIPSSSSADASQTFAVGPSAQTVAFGGGVLGVATVGTGLTLFFPPGCAVTGTVGSPPVAITSISILNGLGGMVQEGSPNVTAPPPPS